MTFEDIFKSNCFLKSIGIYFVIIAFLLSLDIEIIEVKFII